MSEQAFCKTFELDSFKSLLPKKIPTSHQQKSLTAISEPLS